MQTFAQLLIVLPCHSMEDFPTHHQGDDAANLLANWTALWHPSLISACQAMPTWQQADNPDLPETTENAGKRLVLIPSVSESSISPDLQKSLNDQQAVVISEQSSRNEIVRLALQDTADSQPAQVPVDLANDFMALGFAFLQIQLMTRQLRYSSNLDEEKFSQAVVNAANLATKDNDAECREALTHCFDLLLEEKNAYYPVEPELLDVVLTAPTTLGPSLSRQLNQNHPFNLLLTGSDARELAEKHPDNLEQLKNDIAEAKVNIIGGLENELPDPLMAIETVVHQIQIGKKTISTLLDAEPRVFLRRRFGLTPATPRLLNQMGFDGAIHATLEDGKFPRSSSCNIRWTGEDESSILAFGDLPTSAADSGAFLDFGIRLGEAIDSAHVASAMLVHWPDVTCQSFDDLVRITNYSPLFGNFVRFDEYFESIYDPGYGDSFTPDEYKSPYLKQSVERAEASPISRYTQYWNRFSRLAACRALLIQACARQQVTAEQVKPLQSQLAQLQTVIEANLNVGTSSDANDNELSSIEQQIHGLFDGRPAGREIDIASPPPKSKDQLQIVNPTAIKRRVTISHPSDSGGTLRNQPPVVLCDAKNSPGDWVVELPGMGAAFIDVNQTNPKDVFKSDPAVVDDHLLRNEFFELQVDESTGGIRGIQLYRERGNLISQQLAVRIPQKDTTSHRNRVQYTNMVATEVKSSSSSRLNGTIVATGNLMDGQNKIAEFQQALTVTRGSRIIECEIELELAQKLTSSMNHYVCSRLAWKDESARVYANCQDTRQQVTTDWFHGTQFLEVVHEKRRVSLLTGGLPFHRRATRRMIDSILLVGQEQQKTHKFGIGINLPYPLAEAQARMSPPALFTRSHGNQDHHSDWLFHFDCKNIVATWWNPVFDESARWSGVQLRLRETEGRGGKLGIRCPRRIGSAEKTNFLNDLDRSLEVDPSDSTKLSIEFEPYEYFQISIYWKQ